MISRGMKGSLMPLLLAAAIGTTTPINPVGIGKPKKAVKTPLSKKQKKNRSKNKAAKQSRKNNRKF